MSPELQSCVSAAGAGLLSICGVPSIPRALHPCHGEQQRQMGMGSLSSPYLDLVGEINCHEMGICPQSCVLPVQEEVSPAAQGSRLGARAQFVSGGGCSQAPAPPYVCSHLEVGGSISHYLWPCFSRALCFVGFNVISPLFKIAISETLV